MAVELPTHANSFATDAEFSKLFGGSLWIMTGSIVAFVFSQMIDVWAFWFIRRLTGEKMIWLRSTGSTVFSQLVDSYTVLIIGFWIPGTFTFKEILVLGITGYSVKLVIAIGLTPFIYLVRYGVKRILGNEQAEEMSRAAAEESLITETVK